ncbi:hypothetical protein ACQY0O_002293 [Thecaphora frezii]
MFAPLPAAQKKRQRAQPLPRDVASTTSVPRTSTSAASWGVAQLSESEGEADIDDAEAAEAVTPSHPTAGLTTNRRTILSQPPPPKRPHLDDATSGRFASMRLDPNAHHRHPRPGAADPHARTPRRRGVGGVFGQAYLPHGISSELSSFANGDPSLSQLAVPPSSPNKASFAHPLLVEPLATAPPASPEQRPADCGAPPASPVSALPSKDRQAWPPVTFETRDGGIEDMDMRIRRGPTSYEIEPNRIVVNSLDDTSSSSDEDNDSGDDVSTPGSGALTSARTHGGQGTGDFVVNKELMDKLEAHRRAVLTGTSDRDKEQSAQNAKSSGGRLRRGGRKSGGGLFSLGSLLNSRRRSAQSSQASSPGCATPITSEEANGALVLWRDPEEVLRATAASAAASATSNRVNGGGSTPHTRAHTPSSLRQESSSWTIPGAEPSPGPGPDLGRMPPSASVGAAAFSFGDPTSPLAAQQSFLSSSYFGARKGGAAADFGGRATALASLAPQPLPIPTQEGWAAAARGWDGAQQAPMQPAAASSYPEMADEMELDG